MWLCQQNAGHEHLAQALEHDVGAQAENLREMVARLHVLLALEAEAFGDLPPAPPYFQDFCNHKAGLFVPSQPWVVPVSTVKLKWGMIA